MFGKLGDRLNSSCINRYNYCSNLTVPECGIDNTVDSRFVMAVDFDNYGSTEDLEQGMDLTTGAPNCNLVMYNSDNANGIEARVDSYACYDALLNINPDLTASVSF